MSNCWMLCVLPILFFTKGGAIQFSFIPHPTNITILESAVYQCSVTGVQSGDSMSLAWIVNGYSSANQATFMPYIDSVGITGTGIGSLNTSLTIPGSNETLNGTTVKCTALGQVNGAVYSGIDHDTFYIQGELSRVKLSCSSDDPFKILCHWTEPPHILGLQDDVEYNTSVISGTSGAILRGPMIVDDTEYEVDDLGMKFGIYKISVAAVIGELQGEMDNITITRGSIEWAIELIHKNGHLMAHINMELEEDVEPNKKYLLVLIEPDQNTTFNLDEDNNANLTDLGKFNGNVFLVLNFDDAGLQLHSIDSKTISTFNVKNISINDSNPDGSVCFECFYNSFVADNSRGCHVEYNCTEETAHGSFGIPETIKCRYNIPSLTYNITVYDMDDTKRKNPAYYLTNLPINGRENIPILSIPTPPPTTTTTPTTTTPTTIVSTVSASTSIALTSIVIMTVSGIIICLLSTVMALLIFLIIKKKNSKQIPHIAHTDVTLKGKSSTNTDQTIV